MKALQMMKQSQNFNKVILEEANKLFLESHRHLGKDEPNLIIQGQDSFFTQAKSQNLFFR